MGLNSDQSQRGMLVFDVEAAAIGDAAVYLEEPTPPANYSKPEAIAKYVEKAKADQLDKCALDVDLARIVTIATLHSEHGEAVRVCQTEDEERAALEWFWSLLRPYPYPRLVGWNIVGYDLPLLYRRSLYLGVDAPPMQLGKYRHPDVDDLMLIWSWDGMLKFRSLAFVCKRFGVDVPGDELTGADIGAAVAAGEFDKVKAHAQADVQRTAALAARLGYFARQTAGVF